MAKNILVATPQPAFGELLRLSLEESGRYRVRLVQTGREALSSAQRIVFSLAILDAALADPPLLYVAQGLREARPAIQILVIPPQEGIDTPEMKAVQPDGCVDQPFYAPSLIESIDRLLTELAQEVSPSLSHSPSPDHQALTDVNLARRNLEEFLKDSNAPGAVVIHTRQPWASAGQLNKAAVSEIAGLLARYTAANEGVDLARYVHLQADGGEYLIYATPLLDRMILAMVQRVNTPLTVIRAQVGRLARELRSAEIAAPDLPPSTATPEPDAAPQMDEGDDEDGRLEAQATRLADLLAEMPAPNPTPAPAPEPGDWVQASPASSSGAVDFVFPWELDETPQPAPAGSPPPDHPPTPIKDESPPQPAAQPQLEPEEDDDQPPSLPDATATSPEAPAAPGPSPADEPFPLPPVQPADSAGSFDQTRPVVLRTLQSIQQVEPLGPAFSNLAYTCLLIPRLATHDLSQELADRLTEWLPQLCMAYGWRLENLLVRPEYLQWTVQVMPTISPGNMIRLIRQQSSLRVFSQFPQLAVENPSGDFWAPGYLIISGFQPPSLHLVQDYIRQTRQRQGSFTQ